MLRRKTLYNSIHNNILQVVQRIKHDRYLNDLCEKIRPVYDKVSTNILLYSKKSKRLIAEIDILAQRGDELYVYEVKCSYRPVKARKQLRKIKKLMPNITKAFFFCGESGTIETMA